MPGLGLETDLGLFGAESACETRKATSSIPAHFRLAAVRVVVAHPKVRSMRKRARRQGSRQRRHLDGGRKAARRGKHPGKACRPDYRA